MSDELMAKNAGMAAQQLGAASPKVQSFTERHIESLQMLNGRLHDVLVGINAYAGKLGISPMPGETSVDKAPTAPGFKNEANDILRHAFDNVGEIESKLKQMHDEF